MIDHTSGMYPDNRTDGVNPYAETHAVTDDNGRQLYTVTTVEGYPIENRAFLLAQVERLTLELRLEREARELSAQMQGAA